MLNLLKNIRPDLILLDIEMPIMNGYEVLEQLKSNDDTADIPVIFLTAHNPEENEQQDIPPGAVGYITKPFVTQHLLSSIEQALIGQSC